MKLKKELTYIVALLTAFIFATDLRAGARLKALRVEYAVAPIAVQAQQPRFSWQMVADDQKRGYRQTAYRISVADEAGTEVWNSGRVESSASLGIRYEGQPLKPVTRYRWTVEVWDQRNRQTAETSAFETALTLTADLDHSSGLAATDNNSAKAPRTNLATRDGSEEGKASKGKNSSNLQSKDEALQTSGGVNGRGRNEGISGKNLSSLQSKDGTLQTSGGAKGRGRNEGISGENSSSLQSKNEALQTSGGAREKERNEGISGKNLSSLQSENEALQTLGEAKGTGRDEGISGENSSSLQSKNETLQTSGEAKGTGRDEGLSSDETIDPWNGAKWIGRAGEAVSFYADYLPVFSISYDVQLDEASRSTAASLLFGANDPRMMSPHLNLLGVCNAKDSAYIRVELDIEPLSQGNPALLKVYRKGYRPGETDHQPIASLAIPQEIINSGNRYGKHRIDIRCNAGKADFYVSNVQQPAGTEELASVGKTKSKLSKKQSEALTTSQTGKTKPNLDGKQSEAKTTSQVGKTKSDVSQKSLGSVLLNPTGKSGGDYIAYPVVGDLGYQLQAGQRATFANVTVNGYRAPHHTIKTVQAPALTLDGGNDGLLRTTALTENPTPMLRTTFRTADKKIAKARLYATAHGIYDLYLNGHRVSDAYFNPGSTQYDRTLTYQTFDVTNLIGIGEANALGATLAEGWWSGGSTFQTDNWDFFGTRQALLAQLQIVYADGSRQTIVTDPRTWRSYADSPVRHASFFMGEVYDARKAQPLEGWSTASYDDSRWEPAAEVRFVGSKEIEARKEDIRDNTTDSEKSKKSKASSSDTVSLKEKRGGAKSSDPTGFGETRTNREFAESDEAGGKNGLKNGTKSSDPTEFGGTRTNREFAESDETEKKNGLKNGTKSSEPTGFDGTRTNREFAESDEAGGKNGLKNGTKSSEPTGFGGTRTNREFAESDEAGGKNGLKDGTKSSELTGFGETRTNREFAESDEAGGKTCATEKDSDAVTDVIFHPAADDFQLIADPAGPVLPVDTLTAQAVDEPREGIYVYDLGQNMAGVPLVRFRGLKPGTEVKLRFAEMKYPDLPEYEHLKGMIMTENLRVAMCQDIYIAKGDDEETFSPRFTYHGYRFIEVSGVDRALPAEDVQSIVVSSMTEVNAAYTTNRPDVNRLWENTLWSTRSNFISIPTDCPQRNERLGWMGDISVFSRSATYLTDAARFLRRYLVSVRDCQGQDGKFPDVAPTGFGFGSLLWGSAGITVPWELYQQYADRDLLAEHYPAMKRYIDYIQREYIDPETGLIVQHRQWGDLGDWLSLEDNRNDKSLIWECYYIYDLDLMTRMARVLGHDDDAERYAQLSAQRREFFVKTFVDPATGRTLCSAFNPKRQGQEVNTQTSYALPLAFDVVKGDSNESSCSINKEAKEGRLKGKSTTDDNFSDKEANEGSLKGDSATDYNSSNKVAREGSLKGNSAAVHNSSDKEVNEGNWKGDSTTDYSSSKKEAREGSLRQKMAENLREVILHNSKGYPAYSLLTGFIGTAWISNALSDCGMSDVAYRLLTQEDFPSWLYPVKNGATTIWERLNSYTLKDGFGGNNGMNSFNHYSFGAVVAWMQSHSLGIRRDEQSPGFKHFLLKPEPDPTGHITHAEGHYDSPYGRIESSWKREGKTTVYRFTVPANTSATLFLPTRKGLKQKELTSGQYEFKVKE